MINSILFTVFLIYFLKMLGRYILDIFKINNKDLDYGIGLSTYLSILFVTSIPFIYMKLLFQYYFFLQIFLLTSIFIFLIFKHKLFRPSKEEIILFLCTALLYSIYFFIDFNKGGDFQYYLPFVAQNITNSTGVYNFDAWTGVNPYDLYIWYKFVPFELIMSFFTVLSGGSALLYSLWGIPLLLVFSFVYVNYILIKTLYPQTYRIRNYHFMLLGLLIIIFTFTGVNDSNFHFYNNGSFFNLPYAGKSLLYYFVTPFLFLIMYNIFKHPEQMNSYFKVLFLSSFMSICISGSGLFIQGTFLIAFLCIILWFMEDNKQYMINIYYCFLPLIVYLFFSLFTINSIILKGSAIAIIIIYVIGVFILKRFDLFRIKKINRVCVISFVLIVYSSSFLIRIVSYTNTIQFTTFKENIYSDFLSYEPIVALMIIGFTLICLDKKLSFSEQVFYVIFNVVYIILFLNPISAIVISKYITSTDVYWRLFYCTNLIYLLVYILDKLIKKEIESKILQIVGIGLFIISISYFKYPIMEYNKVNLNNEDYSFITKMDNEIHEISSYLTQFDSSKTAVPAEFYRDGIRGIASNLNLFITVYDDRHQGKYSDDKQLMLHFLEYGPDDTEWFVSFVNQFKIEYLVVKNTVQGIFEYPEYFDIIKRFDNYTIIKMKGEKND